MPLDNADVDHLATFAVLAMRARRFNLIRTACHGLAAVSKVVVGDDAIARTMLARYLVSWLRRSILTLQRYSAMAISLFGSFLPFRATWPDGLSSSEPSGHQRRKRGRGASFSSSNEARSFPHRLIPLILRKFPNGTEAAPRAHHGTLKPGASCGKRSMPRIRSTTPSANRTVLQICHAAGCAEAARQANRPKDELSARAFITRALRAMNFDVEPIRDRVGRPAGSWSNDRKLRGHADQN